ncbi:MAG: MauE/DoxX family redox-associated membrane protein [Bacteroidota bacterium]
MKSLFSNEYNVLAARVFLGVLFVVASADKIADPAAFARSIEDYRLISGTAAMVMATILPWVEMLCGLALIAGVLVQASALLSGTLLIVFTMAVISGLVRGLDISCGCFTQDPTISKIGLLKIGENVVLIALTTFLYSSQNIRFSLDRYIRDQQSGS